MTEVQEEAHVQVPRMPANYYFYRMTTDNGGAPCVKDGVWSLAICKPRIRRSANNGDVVIGFAGNSIDAKNGAIHVARIEKRLPSGEYYLDPDYEGRPDRIYEWLANGWRHIANSAYHGAGDLEHDIGAHGERGFVLISREFRYFGSKHRERNQPFLVDWLRFPNLRRILSNLTQGERVHHEPEVRGELDLLIAEIFSTTDPNDIGDPGQESDCPCDRDDDVDVACRRSC